MSRWGLTDHPRECGANHVCRLPTSLHGGSSPRVRGKRGSTLAESHRPRIIPASAGQTVSLILNSVPEPDHPRECGANLVASMVLDGNAGSSPRVRGKLDVCTRCSQVRRIIPASAGQTRSPSHFTGSRQDHPRECGANVVVIFACPIMAGSSPRVRGKQST